MMEPGVRRLNLGLLVALALVALLVWAIRPAPSRPRGPSPLSNMATSRAAESYGVSGVLPDGRTIQPPVPGTIPRDLEPFPYGPDEVEAKRAGDELENPFGADDAAALDRGQKVFATFCAVCHGASGVGDGVVTRRGYPAPPSLLGDKVLSMGDGQIVHIITFGQGNMPAYASQIDLADRWRVVLYVRQLQRQAPAAVGTTQP